MKSSLKSCVIRFGVWNNAVAKYALTFLSGKHKGRKPFWRQDKSSENIKMVRLTEQIGPVHFILFFSRITNFIKIGASVPLMEETSLRDPHILRHKSTFHYVWNKVRYGDSLRTADIIWISQHFYSFGYMILKLSRARRKIIYATEKNVNINKYIIKPYGRSTYFEWPFRRCRPVTLKSRYYTKVHCSVVETVRKLL